ncbi:hypothetical protein K438DRAFT_1977123 [Mycena galopus ATCC 62051]|nr:hypothetical protein K438DRAFT_1977123 [Mycena galopus ATCC 62051]
MRTTTFIALFAALFSPAVAAPATTQVLTPKGYRPASGLVAIPHGGKIVHAGENLQVLDADGTVVHTAAKSPTPASSAVAPEETGWVAYASWLNTAAPIGSFQTTWTVPPVPATNHGQTLFLFNSIEPATFDAIMQPVLQYGGSAAGGGAYWAVASWYLYGSNTFYTTPVEVSVGQQLHGEVQLVGGSGGTYNYNSAFTNVGGSSLTVDGGEELAWATITLETYSTTSSSDYPTGSTVFSGINLELDDGTFPGLNWATVSDTADGITTTINSESSTNGEITITY